MTLEELNKAFEEEKADYLREHQREITKMEYLGNWVFDFTTYDPEMDEKMAERMVEVIQVIVGRTAFEYIEYTHRYERYILMCNMPYLSKRIEWGTSIRGAWIDPEYTEEIESILAFV